jgi:hypothetical protein
MYLLPSSLSVCITVPLWRVALHDVKAECQYMGFTTQIPSKNYTISRRLNAEDFNILCAIY